MTYIVLSSMKFTFIHTHLFTFLSWTKYISAFRNTESSLCVLIPYNYEKETKNACKRA